MYEIMRIFLNVLRREMNGDDGAIVESSSTMFDVEM